MWQFLFWLCLGLVLYSYVGYPLMLAIIGRFKGRACNLPDEITHPSLTLIVSAFNEEKVIRHKVENSLALDYPRELLTIIVASDGSDDHTVDIVREYADHGVKLFHQEQRAGKSAMLNEVIRETSTDIIVFTDANSLFEKDALLRLVPHFADPTIGEVIGRLCYTTGDVTPVGKGEGLYWRYESVLSRLESSLRSVLVANGSIFAVRRALIRELHPAIANDLQTTVEVASQGYGVVYEPSALAVESCAAVWQEEFQRKVRIVLRGLTGFAIMRKQVTGFRLWQFMSHKLARWLAGPLLFVALVANTMLAEESTFFTVLLYGQLLFYAAAANGWRVRRTRKPTAVFYIPFYFTMVNLAAAIATVKFFVGERQAVWEKAESTREIPGQHVPIAQPAGEQLEAVAPEKVAKT